MPMFYLIDCGTVDMCHTDVFGDFDPIGMPDTAEWSDPVEADWDKQGDLVFEWKLGICSPIKEDSGTTDCYSGDACGLLFIPIEWVESKEDLPDPVVTTATYINKYYL